MDDDELGQVRGRWNSGMGELPSKKWVNSTLPSDRTQLRARNWAELSLPRVRLQPDRSCGNSIASTFLGFKQLHDLSSTKTILYLG